jgi:hypothetical protein
LLLKGQLYGRASAPARAMKLCIPLYTFERDMGCVPNDLLAHQRWNVQYALIPVDSGVKKGRISSAFSLCIDDFDYLNMIASSITAPTTMTSMPTALNKSKDRAVSFPLNIPPSFQEFTSEGA